MEAYPSKLRDVTRQASAATVIAEIRHWMGSLNRVRTERVWLVAPDRKRFVLVAVYDVARTLVLERAWREVDALFRLSHVAAQTISAPTKTQISIGSP